MGVAGANTIYPVAVGKCVTSVTDLCHTHTLGVSVAFLCGESVSTLLFFPSQHIKPEVPAYILLHIP